METMLGEILPIQYGKGLVESSRDKSGHIPVYGSSGIVGFHNHALTSKATLIVGRKGSVGSIYYSKSPCWPIDTVYFVEENTNLDLKFFLYLLSFLRLGQFDRSTAIPGLSRDDYNAIKVKIAPFPEQHRIVAAIEQQFTRLDAGVAALKRAKTKLKRYRAAVLKAAVEGRLTETWRAEHPTTEPASLLLERILDERRAKWEADLRAKGKDPAKVKYVEPAKPDVENLPELPDGWCWASVEQICERIVDCLHSTATFQAAGFLCVDTNSIKPGRIVFEKIRYVDEDTFIERNRRMKPQENDVLFSREGALLGVAVRLPANLEICLGQRMMIFRLHRAVDAHYYEKVLNSSVFRSQYASEITGTASPHLNVQDTRAFAIPLPPLAEQEQIVAEVERRLSIINELQATVEANLKRAERLRQSILQEAFAGRIVPQDPTDEPASILLERIRDERNNGHNASNKAGNGRHVLRAPEPVSLDVAETAQAALWESIER
ncbi:MAG: restriction endonuclease subunit S [Ktedonobacteraceae bacterium]